MRIGIDIGGALSEYPRILRQLIDVCTSGGIEIYILSDMQDHDKMVVTLSANGINVPPNRVISANYAAHGESCKAVASKELNLDVLIDDFIGYVATPEAPPLRLLVMPDPSEPYYADEWITDGSEGNFGRRPHV